MIRKNAVKEKLMRGEVAVGSLVSMAHPAVAEILGMAGFDYLMMDGEHGPYNEQTMEHMILACDSVGVVSMARLPINSPDAMLPFLDLGLLGAMLPHCNTREEIERLVEGTKYAPIGKRGMSAGRVTGYGLYRGAKDVAQWNEEMLTIAMIEEVQAVENLPEMLEVPGIDVFHVGSNDLASSMGYTGNADHPVVRDTIASVVKRIREAGRWAQLAPRSLDEAEAKRCIDVGAQMLVYNDCKLLRDMASGQVKKARAAMVAR